MAVKVAINGFGRIGRLAFRQMFGAEGYEVVAINDLTSAKMLAHLLKYDSTQGNYVAQGHTVEYHEGEGEDNYIVVDGKKIVIYKMPNAADLPWGKLGVDVVLECTGFYTSKAKAQAHINAGAKKVVMTDIDYVAVKSAKHNCEINGVADKCEVDLNNLLDDKNITGDLVLANITADVLLILSESIPSRVKNGGVLIMSGIIKSRVNEVIDRYSAIDFELVQRKDEGEWIALVMKKKGGAEKR